MPDFGPTRGETKLYLAISLAGLVLMGVALALRGVGSIVAIEVLLFSGAFFGGTAIWAARRLWGGPK